jgi:hypothetical protein
MSILKNIYIYIYIYIYILDYNFACGSLWVRNLVSNIKGGTQPEGVWEEVAEEKFVPKRD